MLRYRTRAVVLAGVVCTFVTWGTPGRSQQQPRETGDRPTYILVPQAEVEAQASSYKAIATENPAIPVEELALLVKPLTLGELETEAAAWMELVKAKVKEISNAEIAIQRKNRLLDQEKEAVKALEEAKAALEKAEEAQKAATPGSPEAEEAAKQVEEKEEERKEQAEAGILNAPTPDLEEFDLYCNQYGYFSYIDSQSGVEISCIEETAESREIDESAENIKAAAADLEANGTDTELQEKEQQLDAAEKQIEEVSETGEELKDQMIVNVTTLQSERTALVDRLKVVLLEMEAKGGDPTAYSTYIQAVSGVQIDVNDTRGLEVRLLSWLQSEEGGVRWRINITKFASILVVASFPKPSVRWSMAQ
jgi:small conductance mechanosensitive channel